MSQIQVVPINSLDENPHRQLATYPTIEKKIEALMRSFQDVGIWEGIIARQINDRFQLAFGHHRLEAAKRLNLTEIPIIVRDLSDEDMLKFMGRENGEDYATEFLIMLNTWEGAVQFGGRSPKNAQPIDIARVLGWVSVESDDSEYMTNVAKACAGAHALISGGYVSRSDFVGISVKSAKDIVQRAQSRMEAIEKAAKKADRPNAEVNKAKKAVAKGAKITARQVREGEVRQKDIRSQVDMNAYKAAGETKIRETPLFEVFGKALIDSLDRMLDRDAAAEKLREIVKAVNKVTMEQDQAVIRQLDFELSEVATRAENWKKKLIPTNKKVVGLPALENKGD